MESILFICTHNSSRSIISEGLVNKYASNFKAYSAGTEKTQVNQFAKKVLEELGVDTRYLRSKEITEFAEQKFDYVVTVCDSAKETCPFFPAIKEVIHAPFPDPSVLGNSDEEKLNIYRSTMKDIAIWLHERFQILIDLENR